VNALLRQPQRGRSGYRALLAFLLAYLAAMALVIAPDAVKSALDAAWGWPLAWQP